MGCFGDESAATSRPRSVNGDEFALGRRRISVRLMSYSSPGGEIQRIKDTLNVRQTPKSCAHGQLLGIDLRKSRGVCRFRGTVIIGTSVVQHSALRFTILIIKKKTSDRHQTDFLVLNLLMPSMGITRLANVLKRKNQKAAPHVIRFETEEFDI